jgi:hypothetical protein
LSIESTSIWHPFCVTSTMLLCVEEYICL